MVELGQALFGNKWEQHEVPGYVERDLYSLCELIEALYPEVGADGWRAYSHHVDNDVFEMHPYYWGDCTCGFDERNDEWHNSHQHADSCYQTVLNQRCIEQKLSLSQAAEQLAREWKLPQIGCVVHCTCNFNDEYQKWREENDHDPRCPEVLPNFLHKPSGLAVHWYKYLGRSMTCNREVLSLLDWQQIRNECEESLKATPHVINDDGVLVESLEC